MSKQRAVITLTMKKGKLNVACEFTPAAKVKGPMKITHSAAMAAVKGIKAWAQEGA